jgi:hypothetical protein
MDEASLSRALEDLADGLDDRVDLPALRRRIARHRRRRTIAGASVVAIGAVGVTGALAVAHRANPHDTAVSSTPPRSVPTLPACPDATPGARSNAGAKTPTSESTVDGPQGIKATGEVAAITGGRVTVAVKPGAAAPSTLTLSIDATTTWAGDTSSAAQLTVGQSITFAATPEPDGSYHAVAVGVELAPAQTSPDTKPTGTAAPADPTRRKSAATIIAADTTTITAQIHDGPDAGQRLQLSISGAVYTVGDLTCAPTAPLAPGEEIGLEYSQLGGRPTVHRVVLG